MKRMICGLVLMVLMACPATPTTLKCELPDPYIPRGLELCEEIRISLGFRSSDFGNDECASEFLKIGFLTRDRASTRRASKLTVAQAVNDAVDSFNAIWPKITPAICGDGILDTEVPFGEECDDGNNVNGDGCDESCVIEP